MWFFVLLLGVTTVSGQQNDSGYRLSYPRSYIVVAPSAIRPDQTYQVYISILAVRFNSLNIRASIRRNGQEYANLDEGFNAPSTRLSQMKIPGYAEPGNYTLVVEGYADGLPNNIIFTNVTDLLFSQKHVSLFIQTDKLMYQKKSVVKYRVIAVKPNLMPVKSGSINIYVKDGKGKIVRRWLSKQIYMGYFEGEIPTAHPCNHGWWTIEVEGWGYRYRKQFHTENYFYNLFEVNVTVPAYIYENEHGLGGTLGSNYTMNGVPVRGNATVELEIRKNGQTEAYPKITKYIPKFEGVTSFLFTMAEIRAVVGDVKDTQLVVHASVYDWYSLESKTMTGSSCIYQFKHRIQLLGGRVRTFKPGAELPVFIAAYMPDGSRWTSERYRMILVNTVVRRTNGQTSVQQDSHYIIPDDGIVKHTVIPDSDAQMITIRAGFADGTESFKELRAYRHYTKENHYIAVTTSTTQPKVDHFMVFTIKCTTYIEQIYYLMTAGGNIVASGILLMSGRQKSFSVAASRDMVPNARILVYGVLNSGEILADAINMHVSGQSDNEVSVSVNKGKNLNLDTIEISGRTAPGAFIFFGAENYALYSREHSNFLSRDQVEADQDEYETIANTSFHHTWYHDEGQKENVFFPAPTVAADANTTFVYSGLTVFTDATLTRISNAEEGRCNYTNGYRPCMDGSCYSVSASCDGVWQCEDGVDELGCPDPTDQPVKRPDQISTLDRIYWHFDNTDWAWNRYLVKPDGRVDFQTSLPMRPATWLIGAVSVSLDNGLTFSDKPARVDTTRGFHMIVELPSSSYRGEQLGIQLSLFNYWNQPLEALIILQGSKQYRFVNVEDFGIVSSYKPRTTYGDVQTMVYLFPGQSRFIHFPILPIVLGRVKVTVSASSFVHSYTVSKTLTVKMDGVTNTYHTPYLVDLVHSGSMLIPDMEIPIPERFINPGQRQHLYVPGSEKGTVSLVGDVVGPGFFSSHVNAKKVLGIIFGSGEDYLFNFGVNLYWLRFLKTINQLSESTKIKALEGLNKDLQNIYSYILSDGGMAARRSRSLSDVWTTALALDLLSQGLEPEWEYHMFIDVDILSNLAIWLCDQQNVTTGAFQNPTFIYATKFMGNGTDTNYLNATMTAQSVIGLKRSLGKLNGAAQTRATSALVHGANYLSNIFHLLTHPFDICMVTYALYVANHGQKGSAFVKMASIRREGEYVYWSEAPIPPNPTKIVNTVQYLQARELPLPFSSSSIQATSYALMVYLLTNRYADAVPIMKWLQTQRDTDAGFNSVQDSLVATQALVQYGESNTNRDLYSMLLNLQLTSSPNWTQSYYLQKGNFLNFNTLKLPTVWGSVRTVAQGTGLALLQMTSKVNVEYPHQMRQYQRAFDLDIERLVFTGRNSSMMEMNICVKWVATDLAPRSGAVIIEVDIPTGFYVRKQELRKYQRTGRLWSMRSRYTSQKVVLYIDYIDPEGACWYFPGERWYPVANGTIQHRIRVYDTNEMGLQNNTMYTTYNMFSNNMCQVCGSFQCPYCRDYNRGVTVWSLSGTLLSVWALMSALWASRWRL